MESFDEEDSLNGSSSDSEPPIPTHNAFTDSVEFLQRFCRHLRSNKHQIQTRTSECIDAFLYSQSSSEDDDCFLTNLNKRRRTSSRSSNSSKNEETPPTQQTEANESRVKPSSEKDEALALKYLLPPELKCHSKLDIIQGACWQIMELRDEIVDLTKQVQNAAVRKRRLTDRLKNLQCFRDLSECEPSKKRAISENNISMDTRTA